ncbi:hypothetical protein BV898_00133 [Hypsibius exemplaris]|uniref:Uncharacterized protein n=1 Tax=Hypsibius exemplaris TaxID=2072580 RepID=A0A1W0XEU4_HYPEX|nr:hypothetical protein BV898_00133 [Hypsibius exemplaris]
MASLSAPFLCLSILAVASTGANFPAFSNNFGNFGSSMQPLSFPGFQMQAMRQSQNQQSQGQSQGQSAATGDGSADEGNLNSAQTSNTNTSDSGTIATGGSLGQCDGINCKINGASQVGTQGAFQGQRQSLGQGKFGAQSQGGSPQFPAFGLFGANQNSALQNQFQSQFQTGGASIGSGNVDKGTVQSVQNTNAITNKEGSQVLSTSLGQGAGTNAGLSGAVQATGQGQTAKQTVGLSSSDQNQQLTGLAADNVVGSLTQAGQTAAKQKQKQSQTQGSGAAVGSSNAVEGTVTNALSSNVNTNAQGTSVNSNAANTATGKGIKVNGSVSASGSGQSQSTNQLALNLLQGGGLSARPRSQQPVPVGGATY